MKTLRIIIFLSLVMSIYSLSIAQNTGKLNKLIEGAVLDEKNINNLIEITTRDSLSAKYALLRLEIYYTDNKLSIRQNSYYLIQRIAHKSQQNSVKQNAVYILVNGLKDKKEGLTGQLFNYLEQFYQCDFNSETKDSLRSIFQQRTAHFSRLIKLIGFLELSDMEIIFRDITKQESKYSKKEKWAARLALARMGDSYIIEQILKTVRQNPVNDNTIYNVIPDLAYIKQAQIIDYFLEILYNDSKNCSSPDLDSNEKIMCAYRMMEFLAPIMVGFPYKLDVTGDLDTSDYESALQTVREWFSSKQGDYIIKRDRY